MSGKDLILEEDMEEIRSKQEVDLWTTSFWYGPHSPLSCSQKQEECTSYRHIFFPTKL